jgi:Omp85 superfamily domain
LLRQITILLLLFNASIAFAQNQRNIVDSLKYQKDLQGTINSALHTKFYDTLDRRHLNWFVLPLAIYNRQIGFSPGVTSFGGKTFGHLDSTSFSVMSAGAYLSIRGLPTVKIRHNIFTANNKWNLVGHWLIGRTVAIDNGIGTSSKSESDGNFTFGNEVFDDNAAAFQINYTYLKLSERAYRRITKHFYAGAGLGFDVYDNIIDPTNSTHSHNYRYSLREGYNPKGYSANGILFNLQYNSRDQTNRSYKGFYLDLVLKVNQTWLGSEKTAEQLKVEFRKYWSLSKTNPEMVIAVWHWADYLLGGSVPYLDLPGTGSDDYGRAGRGYVISRFKGISFVYNEAEFRYPITENKLLSAVAFVNAETGSSQNNVKLFQYYEPAAGVGFRLLFNKYTRSNLCVDYARGNYGSRGLFLGVNEVF